MTIDDGWERAWGDWRERDAFGGTLADLAASLRARSVTLGLWLAPFAVDPAAPLATEHPEWMVRDERGAALLAELVPGRRFQVLDMTVPAAREHLRALFASLRARGISLFKIDFLFAAALPAVRSDPSVTSLQAYRLGLAAIAEGAGDAHINGCGAVILPAVPYVDSMRVGADLTFSGTPPFWAAVAAAARNLAARRGVHPLGRAGRPRPARAARVHPLRGPRRARHGGPLRRGLRLRRRPRRAHRSAVRRLPRGVVHPPPRRAHRARHAARSGRRVALRAEPDPRRSPQPLPLDEREAAVGVARDALLGRGLGGALQLGRRGGDDHRSAGRAGPPLGGAGGALDRDGDGERGSVGGGSAARGEGAADDALSYGRGECLSG
ncbi:MAG: alpha-galactosidase [Deltaproteobacteria bacterium]|nr:alpha-galactosidase [Deltaproteobacteria bacterium]